MMRRIIAATFTCAFALALVGCPKDDSPADDAAEAAEGAAEAVGDAAKEGADAVEDAVTE